MCVLVPEAKWDVGMMLHSVPEECECMCSDDNGNSLQWSSHKYLRV